MDRHLGVWGILTNANSVSVIIPVHVFGPHMYAFLAICTWAGIAGDDVCRCSALVDSAKRCP